jgi:hypothetical protein
MQLTVAINPQTTYHVSGKNKLTFNRRISMPYIMRSIIPCLLACTTLYSADQTPQENKTHAHESIEQILMGLTSDLQKIAKKNYDNGFEVLQTLETVMLVHPPRCKNHTTAIVANQGGLDFMKSIFANPAEKHNLTKTALEKATEQFVQAWKVPSNRSDENVGQVSLYGTQTMMEQVFEVPSNGFNPKQLLRNAIIYGNVEMVKFLTQKIPAADIKEFKDVKEESFHTLKDFLYGNSPYLTPKLKTGLTMLNTVAELRLEYMQYESPDTYRETCPFKVCKRLVREAANAAPSDTAGNTPLNTHSTTSSND